MECTDPWLLSQAWIRIRESVHSMPQIPVIRSHSGRCNQGRGRNSRAYLGHGRNSVACLGHGRNSAANVGHGRNSVAYLGHGRNSVAILGRGRNSVACLGGAVVCKDCGWVSVMMCIAHFPLNDCVAHIPTSNCPANEHLLTMRLELLLVILVNLLKATQMVRLWRRL